MTGQLSSGYPIDFYNLTVVVAIDEHNKISYSFVKKFVDISPAPVVVKSFDDVNRWYDDPMLYYFQQYKFALYCATALCGVSKDQLTRGLPLTKAILNFHVMYQTKKMLAQMEIRNLGDRDFDPYNNPYNKTEYCKLLNEFRVTAKDIPEIDQPPGGLGFIIQDGGSKVGSLQKQMADLGRHHKPYPKYPSSSKDKTDMDVHRSGANGWGTYYQFPEWNSSAGTKMVSVTQDPFDYKRVVPDHSKSFTSPGIVRLNDSIRAYVYCLLGAQVQARQAGSSLESQQEFLVLVNDLIMKKQSLQDSISNFEDALTKTRGQTNYVIAKGLYMIPSDLNLNALGQSVKGFNDKIKIAQAFDSVGIKPPPPKPKPTPLKPSPKPAQQPKPAQPVPKPAQPVPLQQPPKPAPLKQPPAPTLKSTPSVKPSIFPTELFSPKPAPSVKPSTELSPPEGNVHEGNKLLIGGTIVIAGIAYSMM